MIYYILYIIYYRLYILVITYVYIIVYCTLYPPTPADARGSAPGNKTFDPLG